MYSRRGFISAINYVKDAIISFYFVSSFCFHHYLFYIYFHPFLLFYIYFSALFV